MKKVLVFSVLLVLGLAGSQLLPGLLGGAHPVYDEIVTLLTMAGLAFIMIHVGYEFDVDRSNLKPYGWDYVVAMTAAAFPWIFVTLYFLVFLLPPGSIANAAAWKETLLAGRFAAPTSAGVLFSMLAAAGLSATWLFRKARILAIFDDLDTVLLMVPLKMLMVGLAWQLGAVVGVMAILLGVGWRWLHKIRIPISWPWVLGYSATIAGASEAIYRFSKIVDTSVPVHIEVLLPAFVLGCVSARPAGAHPHDDDRREGHQEGPESPEEQLVSTIVSGAFMVLVGLSLPPILGDAPAKAAAATVTASASSMGAGAIAFHVLMVTIVSNLGKMFPAFCYRREANRRERLAVAIGMWPRGEVGAGVLVLGIGYGIGGPVVTVAMLSLALNLLLTGVFVWIVRRLLAGAPGGQAA